MIELRNKPERISAQETRQKQTSGAPVLLVSAYPRKRYDRFHLEGAIPLEELEGRLATPGKQQEIIFY